MNDNIKYNYETKHIIYVVLGIVLALFAYFNLIQDDINNDVVVKSPIKYKEQNKTKQVPTSIENSLSTINNHTKVQTKEASIEQVNKQMPPTKNATKVKDFAKCYNLDGGSYIINNQCKNNILKYIKKHKDAKYFEIIGIVDGSEFKLYKNLENNRILYDILGVTESSVKLMKKLTNSGLAKHRANEASWIIKANTKQTAVTYNPHYHIISTEGKKGMLVRAYK